MPGRVIPMRRRTSKAALFSALIWAAAGYSSSSAQEAKPFYDGKTIQFVVSSGPGASTDIGARLVARYLGKHISGNPGIVVQNMPGAGSVSAANHLFNIAKPDGLTILAVSRANYLDQMIGRPEVRTDFRKFSWIGSFNRAPMMVACRTDTPYKSVAAMRAAKAPVRFGQAGTGSISYVFANLINKIFDLKIKNVTGFGSDARSTWEWNGAKQTAGPPPTSPCCAFRGPVGSRIILSLSSCSRDRKNALLSPRSYCV